MSESCYLHYTPHPSGFTSIIAVLGLLLTLLVLLKALLQGAHGVSWGLIWYIE